MSRLQSIKISIGIKLQLDEQFNYMYTTVHKKYKRSVQKIPLSKDNPYDKIIRGRNWLITDTKHSLLLYFSGMKREELLPPIPGRPCLTGLYVIENSPK